MKKRFIVKFFNEKFKTRDVARKLQASEYQRRLKDLNGEAGRLRNMQERFVSRELFDTTVNELRGKIYDLEKYKSKQEGRSQLIQWVPWLIAIIAIIANYFKR